MPTIGITKLYGIHLADYDLCLAVKSPEEGNDLLPISGQFCWLDTNNGLPDNLQYELDILNETLMQEVYEKFSKDFANSTLKNRVKISKQIIREMIDLFEYNNRIGAKLSIGLCIPSTCRTEDLELVINKSTILMNLIRLGITFTF